MLVVTVKGSLKFKNLKIILQKQNRVPFIIFLPARQNLTHQYALVSFEFNMIKKINFFLSNFAKFITLLYGIFHL